MVKPWNKMKIEMYIFDRQIAYTEVTNDIQTTSLAS